MSEYEPYNPLDKKNLGASVAEALLGRKLRPLDGVEPFKGAGIYAIYYSGQLAAYAAISGYGQAEPPVPIYVGKAVPSGGRKGVAVADASKSKALWSRLKEHAESILAARASLSLADFTCRYLVVDDIWIPLGESLLISKFSPIWNSLIDGFGNHDPGKGRYQGMRPRWDVLHPGRSWALKCVERAESAEQIAEEVRAHLANRGNFPTSSHFLVESPRGSYAIRRTESRDA